MVKPKQKWTREEEEALCAGVEKYGQGKWKVILDDPQFAPTLVKRSNIDLKDKWRNMTISALGSIRRERVRNPLLELDLTVNSGPSAVLEGPDLNLINGGVGSSSTNRVGTVLEFDLNLPYSPEHAPVLPLVAYGGTPEPSPVLPLVAYGGTPEPSRSTMPMSVENINEGENEEDDRSGQEDAIPMNVENIHQGEDEEDEIGRETPEDVANDIARMIAKSEDMNQMAIDSCKKRDVLGELLEENMVWLTIFKDIHKQCKREGVVLLKI